MHRVSCIVPCTVCRLSTHAQCVEYRPLPSAVTCALFRVFLVACSLRRSCIYVVVADLIVAQVRVNGPRNRARLGPPRLRAMDGILFFIMVVRSGCPTCLDPWAARYNVVVADLIVAQVRVKMDLGIVHA